MRVLTDEEKAALRVESFIFHAVHHGQPEPTLHDGVSIGGFAEFFIERVVETLRGNRFTFDTGSTTLRALRGIEADPATFVEASKDLARRLHRTEGHEMPDGRFKRGILMVTVLSAGPRRFHSLIKYDHGERVIDIVERGSAAVLEEVVNPLTQNRKALQKSALIELDDAGGQLVVVDHSKRSGITDFFRGFLGVRRAQAEADLTKAVERSLRKTVQTHAAELPPEIGSQWRQRLRDIAARRREFEPDQFFGDLFGANDTAALRATWRGQLAANEIDGEQFTFDPDALPDTGPTRYRTAENIDITVPAAARDRFNWERQADGSVVITIRAGALTQR
ncbi:nucleoid-associated protein [Methylobacterium radiodurans]|uniref:Nucleoid-associated protein n=1 Tax=Methylobacterium radiodurans TaxID=2202828 RepID=A0A2U8VLA5_9HYPH|nr:nucleoid-associated protein [Methylobacterium radiodurans]AWN34394.1 hypothetical protein DK427_00410 [Methylobacterium radiodurans]